MPVGAGSLGAGDQPRGRCGARRRCAGGRLALLDLAIARQHRVEFGVAGFARCALAAARTGVRGGAVRRAACAMLSRSDRRAPACRRVRARRPAQQLDEALAQADDAELGGLQRFVQQVDALAGRRLRRSASVAYDSAIAISRRMRAASARPAPVGGGLAAAAAARSSARQRAGDLAGAAAALGVELGARAARGFGRQRVAADLARRSRPSSRASCLRDGRCVGACVGRASGARATAHATTSAV